MKKGQRGGLHGGQMKYLCSAHSIFKERARFVESIFLVSEMINPFHVGPRAPPRQLPLGVMTRVEFHLVERVFARAATLEVFDYSAIAVSLKRFCICGH